jgi:hypothetical protein
MAFNGSGTYTLPAGNPVVTGTTISSSTTNTTNSDIATALTNCITRDGQSTPSANLPMNAKKLTGLAAGTSAGDSVRYEQVVLTGGALGTPTSGNLSNCTDAIAYGIKSATTTVSVSGASAPTTGQALIATSSTAATWQTVGSGALTLLSTVSASNAATVDIETTFNSTYDAYLLICTGVTQSGANNAIGMRMKIGGTYLTANYQSSQIRTSSNGTNLYSGSDSGSAASIDVGAPGSSAGRVLQLNVWIRNPTSTTFRHLINYEGVQNDETGTLQTRTGVGSNTTTGALTGIRFFPAADTMSGKFRLYGISN